MDWLDIQYWYEDLEARDKWKLVGLVTLALVLLVPWRRSAEVEASVRQQEGLSYPLLAPANGQVKEVRAEMGAILVPGTVVYTYITSDQQQLRRAYSEQIFRPRGGVSGDVQLAQNALERAQAVPAELGRKMEQELASIRKQWEDFYPNNAAPFAFPYNRPQPAAEEVPVRGEERVLVMALPIRQGSLVIVGSACATLLPESAAMAVQAPVPAALARDLRAGMLATLEVTAWLHDAKAVPLFLETVGNRTLEPDEVAALAPHASQASRDSSYVLVTFAPAGLDSGLFPPPATCRVQVKGVPRCLLQRMLF